MKLKMKTAGMIGITMAAFIVLLFLLMRPMILEDAKRMDEESLKTDMERAEKYIASEKANLKRHNKDWATWDDTYEFMQNRNPKYIESNLTQESYRHNGTNFKLYLDNNGDTVYSAGYELGMGTLIGVEKDLENTSALLDRIDEENGLSVLWNDKYGPVLLAAEEILTSEGKGPVAGRLVTGVILNEAFFEKMQEDLAINVRNAGSMEQNSGIREVDGNTISGVLAIGNGLNMEVERERKYYSQKAKSMNDLFRALSVATLLLVLLVHYLLDLLIVSRISSLSLQLKDVNFDEEHSLAVRKSQAIPDEITDLETSIQDMLDSLEKAHTDVSKLAFYDQLTGLPNRFSLYKEFLNRVRDPESSFAVLFFDLDGFKRINDLYGHSSGDEMLKQVGERLTGSLLHTGSQLYRIGGDEFVLLSPATVREELTGQIEKVMGAVQKVFVLDKVKTTISTSIGVSFYPANAATLDDLLQYADTAMYAAKKNGKNTYIFYEDLTDRHLHKYLLNLKTDLSDAIALDQFFLEYQPIMDNKGRSIKAVEALIRWNHPKEGLVAPLRFIPLAEESGMMREIGEWVIRQAVAEVQNWNTEYSQSLSLAVNVSKMQLRFKGELLALIDDVLAKNNFPAHKLQIEITESDTVAEQQEIVSFITALKARGIQVALDDFGVGTSALFHLLELDVDIVKIDRSFLRQVPSSKKDSALLKGIYSTLDELDIKLVTEGIETAEQLDFVTDKNDSYLQGYYFSKPLPLHRLREVQDSLEGAAL